MTATHAVYDQMKLSRLQMENEQLRADKDVQRSQARNASYEADIERLRTDYSILKQDYDALREELANVRADARARAALEPKSKP